MGARTGRRFLALSSRLVVTGLQRDGLLSAYPNSFSRSWTRRSISTSSSTFGGLGLFKMPICSLDRYQSMQSGQTIRKFSRGLEQLSMNRLTSSLNRTASVYSQSKQGHMNRRPKHASLTLSSIHLITSGMLIVYNPSRVLHQQLVCTKHCWVPQVRGA